MKFTLFIYCNFLVLLSTTVWSQHINKQNVNISDETLSDYSFLSRYRYTKSKNYSKRRYWIRHWIPMFIGTPCINVELSIELKTWIKMYLKALQLCASKIHLPWKPNSHPTIKENVIKKCELVSNKLQNGWTNRAQILCGQVLEYTCS